MDEDQEGSLGIKARATLNHDLIIIRDARANACETIATNLT